MEQQNSYFKLLIRNRIHYLTNLVVAFTQSQFQGLVVCKWHTVKAVTVTDSVVASNLSTTYYGHPQAIIFFALWFRSSFFFFFLV